MMGDELQFLALVSLVCWCKKCRTLNSFKNLIIYLFIGSDRSFDLTFDNCPYYFVQYICGK